MIIKFFCDEYEYPAKAQYTQSICLAYGLKQKGIDFFGENNFWFDQESNSYLIRKDQRNYDIAIYSDAYVRNNSVTLDSSKYNVLYDQADGIGSWAKLTHLPFDLVLRTHYTERIEYTKNVKPWVFYIPSIVRNTIKQFHSQEITEDVWVNHRIVEGHPIRTHLYKMFVAKLPAERIFEKIIENEPEEYPSYWAQTGRRYNPLYFKELSKHRFTFSFGGSIYQEKLIQYDSWRFWETMYSSSIPLQLNLSNWDCSFPVKPIENKHYIPILDSSSIENLFEYSTKELNEISKQGIEFIEKYYTEEQLTNYFLENVQTSHL